jgi:hypothetical protein
MLINCAFVGHKKTLIFIEMHGATTKKKDIVCYQALKKQQKRVS